MRILHINSYYATSAFYRQLYDEQRALGEDPTVFVPVPRGSDLHGFDFGDYAVVSPDHEKIDRAFFHWKHFRIARDARARFGAASFDGIHAHSLFTNGSVAREMSRRLGVPYVVAVRDTDVNVFFRRMPHLRALGRRVLRDAAKVIFISKPYRDGALAPYLSEEELRAVREKSEVITNGVDRFWLENPAPPRTAPRGEVRVLCVGLISRRKNTRMAAEAVEALAARGVPACLTCIGRVVDEDELRAVQAHACAAVLPPRPMKELLPLYREHDLFLLPSRRETFGLVYAEAMTQALPVLYTRGQGFDGQFEPGEVGMPIDPDDASGIADAMQALLRDYEAVSARCADRSRRYDWARIAARYDEIYREIAR